MPIFFFKGWDGCILLIASHLTTYGARAATFYHSMGNTASSEMAGLPGFRRHEVKNGGAHWKGVPLDVPPLLDIPSLPKRSPLLPVQLDLDHVPSLHHSDNSDPESSPQTIDCEFQGTPGAIPFPNIQRERGRSIGMAGGPNPERARSYSRKRKRSLSGSKPRQKQPEFVRHSRSNSAELPHERLASFDGLQLLKYYFGPDDTCVSSDSESEHVDAGIPPQVPPHRVLSNRILIESEAERDERKMSADIYTRKCSQLRRKATDVVYSHDAKLARNQFVLDGYTDDTVLRVVNGEPCNACDESTSEEKCEFPEYDYAEYSQDYDAIEENLAPRVIAQPWCGANDYRRSQDRAQSCSVHRELCSGGPKRYSSLTAKSYFVPSKALLAERHERSCAV